MGPWLLQVLSWTSILKVKIIQIIDLWNFTMKFYLKQDKVPNFLNQSILTHEFHIAPKSWMNQTWSIRRWLMLRTLTMHVSNNNFKRYSNWWKWNPRPCTMPCIHLNESLSQRSHSDYSTVCNEGGIRIVHVLRNWTTNFWFHFRLELY